MYYNKNWLCKPNQMPCFLKNKLRVMVLTKVTLKKECLIAKRIFNFVKIIHLLARTKAILCSIPGFWTQKTQSWGSNKSNPESTSVIAGKGWKVHSGWMKGLAIVPFLGLICAISGAQQSTKNRTNDATFVGNPITKKNYKPLTR